MYLLAAHHGAEDLHMMLLSNKYPHSVTSEFITIGILPRRLSTKHRLPLIHKSTSTTACAYPSAFSAWATPPQPPTAPCAQLVSHFTRCGDKRCIHACICQKQASYSTCCQSCTAHLLLTRERYDFVSRCLARKMCLSSCEMHWGRHRNVTPTECG